MTSQQAQLQALITEIEALLNKASPRLPWKMTGEATEQRRVMEQALSYLRDLQETDALTPGWGLVARGETAIAPDAEAAPESPTTAEATSQQVLQALLQEMQYLRAQMVQPLTQEVMALQQQRETLLNEVRQLELERLRRAEQSGTAQLDPVWIDEVVGQLRSSLLEQLTPQLQAFLMQADETPALYGVNPELIEPATDLPQLSPQQRLEQLRQIQAQTDHMLLRLDANLRAVFESLDQSIQSYCDTLNQGLDAMHGLGQQGEFVFRTFINHLAQQLQQETSQLTSNEGGMARLAGRDRDFDPAAETRLETADRDIVDRGTGDAAGDFEDVDLSEFDLDADIDEEITLFQLDEEFSEVDLDEEADLDDLDADLAAAPDDEDQTVMQTEPLSWAEVTERMKGESPAAPTSEQPATAVPYTEEIDSLYASLFGETGVATDEQRAIASDAAAPETVDETLLNAVPPDVDPLDREPTATAASPEAVATPAETSLEDLLAVATEVGLEADETAEPPSLAQFLGTEIAEELSPATAAAAAPEPDVIASLAELLPASEPSSYPQFADPFAAFDESGDSFIPAPPDEDLLETASNDVGTVLELDLDDETFGQLTSDLSQLEGLAMEELQVSPTFDQNLSQAPAELTQSDPSDLDETGDADLTAEAAWDWPETPPPSQPAEIIPDEGTAELLTDEAIDRSPFSESPLEPADETAIATSDLADAITAAELDELLSGNQNPAEAADITAETEDFLVFGDAAAGELEVNALIDEAVEPSPLPAEAESFTASTAPASEDRLSSDEEDALLSRQADLEVGEAAADLSEESAIAPDFAATDLFSEIAEPAEYDRDREAAGELELDQANLEAGAIDPLLPIAEATDLLADWSDDATEPESEIAPDFAATDLFSEIAESTEPSFDREVAEESFTPAEPEPSSEEGSPETTDLLSEVPELVEPDSDQEVAEERFPLPTWEPIPLEDAIAVTDLFFAEPETEPLGDSEVAEDNPASAEPTADAVEDAIAATDWFFEVPETAEADIDSEDMAEPFATPEPELGSIEGSLETTDWFFEVPDTVEAVENDAEAEDRLTADAPEPGLTAATFDNVILPDLDLSPELPAAIAEPEVAPSPTDEAEILSVDNVFGDVAAEPTSFAEAVDVIAFGDEFGAATTEAEFGIASNFEAEDSGFTLADAFGEAIAPAIDETPEASDFTLNDAFGSDDSDFASQLGEIAAADALAADPDTGLTAADFDLPVEPSDRPETAEPLTADSFELPVEPPLWSEEDNAADTDFSLSLEGIALDLEIPELSEEEMFLPQRADAVDRAIADNESALTLEAGLFDDIDLPPLPASPPSDRLPDQASDQGGIESPTPAETFEDWSSAMDEAIALTGPSSPVVPNEGAVTPDQLIDELELDTVPTDIPPVETEASLEGWAASFGSVADAETSEFLSFDDLDIDLSLDLETEASALDTEPNADPEGDLFSGFAAAAEPPMAAAAVASEDEPATPPELPPEAASLSVTGSVEDGFEVVSTPDDFEQLRQSLAAHLPDHNDPLPQPVTEAARPDPSLSPGGLDIAGSAEAGFSVTPPATDEALAASSTELPTPAESRLVEPDAVEPMGIIGLPESQAWPTDESAERSPLNLPTQDFAVEGTTDSGFHFVADAVASQTAVMEALTELGPAAAWEVDTIAPTPSAADQALQQQYGQGAGQAAGEPLIAATALPFGAVPPRLPEIPDYDPQAQPAPPATGPDEYPTEAASSPAATATPETSGLSLQGSPAAGFELAALDDAALQTLTQHLENLADLPTTAADSQTPETADQVEAAAARSRPRPPAADTVALDPPTSTMPSFDDSDFSGDDAIANDVDIDLAADRDFTDPTVSATSDIGMPSTADLETELEVDLEADSLEDISPNLDEVGPLSDDEFADFFPPRTANNIETDLDELFADPTAASDLDELFADPIAAADQNESGEDLNEPAATIAVPEAEIPEAIAGLMETKATPVADTDEYLLEEENFAELFPPEATPTAEAETPVDATLSTESDRLEPIEPASVDVDIASIDLDPTTADAEPSSGEPSLEDMLFAERRDDTVLNLTADSASWDPMAADFQEEGSDLEPEPELSTETLDVTPPATTENPENVDFTLTETTETTETIDDFAPSAVPENFDLAMEEIPDAEIENDEAFRSAFEADFALEDALTVDENSPLAFDLNDLGNFAESEEEAIMPSAEAASAETDLLDETDPLRLDADALATDLLDETDPLAPEAVTDSLPTAPPEAETAQAEVTDAMNATATDEAIADDALFASSGLLATIPTDSGEDDPDLDFEPEGPAEEWFLGIDFGSNGLSAVLMERVTGTAHPLCWLPQTGSGSPQATFRMPTVAALQPQGDEPTQDGEITAVGLAALPAGGANSPAVLLNQLRPWLRVGIPHQTTLGSWEPMIQWSDYQTVPLQQVIYSVRSLLALINRPEAADLERDAVGLETDLLRYALDNLQGIVVGLPSNWSDTYCLNVREAVLAAGLIESPSQIFFVEDAIAAVLSGLPDPNDPPADNRQAQTLYQCNWQGGTVVISSGAACTEVGIVDLPYPLDALTRDDFKLRNLAYGGDALDLDIICQLLAPAERRQQVAPGDRRASRDGWSWQATLPEVANAQWDSLELEAMDLPQLAEPDISARTRLRQHLESSKLGQSLLEAARYLKLILQNQNQYQLDLADQSWKVLRRDLESRVLVPYIQRLNQQVNALLSQTGLSSQGINQVICTGGNASFNTIAKWLRQKFPNATIIQDTYPSNRPQTCSRVAYGLVNLCRYPQVLDVPRHQYSDYFLLHEIIRVVPETPLPLNGILHLLQEQGLNTDVCQSRIEAILEGHLPPGLIPDSATREQLSRPTLASETYQGLTAGTLFTKQTRQIYMLNAQQRDRIGNHLAAIMLNKQQALTEPLIAQLVTV